MFDNMLYFWLIAMIVFGLIEAASIGLTSIWFALGALVSMIVAALAGPVWLQVVLFILVSAACLAFVRPLAKTHLNNRKISTNADRAIGKIGVVKEQICNLEGRGAVYIDGKLWTARSQTGEDIDAEEQVEILSIEGVKLIVKKANI